MMMIHNGSGKKSQTLRLVPGRCLAIGLFHRHPRQSTTPLVFSSGSSSSSLLSSSSMIISQKVPSSHRPSPLHQNDSQQKILEQKNSIDSSITSASTANNDCLCHQPVNCVNLFTELIKENTSPLPIAVTSQSQTLQQTPSPISSSSSSTTSSALSSSSSSSSSSTSSKNVLPNYLSSSSSVLNKIDLIGFIYPGTLLVTGQNDALEKLCFLWSKRCLKPPAGYVIQFVGYTNILEMSIVGQTHFTPLAEALYRCINELNAIAHNMATYSGIVQRLFSEFPSMELPCEEILRNLLNTLVVEGKLAYDWSRQTYSTTQQSAFHLPWDHEFETLSLSDDVGTNKSNKDDDHHSTCHEKHDKSIHLTRSKSFSEKFSSTNGKSFKKDKSKLATSTRPNSSMSNEILNKKTPSINEDNINGKSFKRSKSFKHRRETLMLDHADGVDDDNASKKCTCSEIFKRQSLLSKLLKFGQHNSYSKMRSAIVPFTNHNHDSNHRRAKDFGSQFPDNETLVKYKKKDDDERIMAMINQQQQQQPKSFETKAIQTVKSGPDELVTVIMRRNQLTSDNDQVMKQRSLMVSPSSCRKHEIDSDECCSNIHHNHNHHQRIKRQQRRSRCQCFCEFKNQNVSYPPNIIKHRNQKTKKLHNHHHHHHHQPRLSHWNNVSSNLDNRFDFVEKETPNKTKNSTYDSQGRRKNLISTNKLNQQNSSLTNGSRYFNGGIRMGARHQNCYCCGNGVDDGSFKRYDGCFDQKNIVYKNGNDKNLIEQEEAEEGYNSNNLTMVMTDNGYRESLSSSSSNQLKIPSNNNHHQTKVRNNSLSVKIEIETSSLRSPRERNEFNSDDDLKSLKRSQFTLTPQNNSYVINALLPRRRHSNDNHQNHCFCLIPNGNEENEKNGNGTIFTNEMYSELNFENLNHSNNFVGFEQSESSNLFEFSRNEAFLFSDRKHQNKPELNYANSITALKQQIAIAKRNFFKESFA